jgi:glycosyltransferase involved in cell wall biosynthesis
MRDCLLSVAICTFNRAAFLDDALRSFAATDKLSDIPFELLVIDNNSGDSTRSVVERWAARSKFPLRYVFEGKQGLSVARNRAIKEMAGHWVWYVDDDVYFSPRWLDGVLEGIKFFPQSSVLAGRVLLAFEPAKPSWLPPSALPHYGMTSFGDELRWLKRREFPVGANMAFRRPVFDEVGLFREDLGRVADSLLSAEETDMVIRLYQRGHKIGYVPGAAVWHRVSEDRATMSWLKKRAYWGGVSYVLAVGTLSNLSRFGLIGKAVQKIGTVGKAVLTNGCGLNEQIYYAWQLGAARQYLAEAARNNGSRAFRSGF